MKQIILTGLAAIGAYAVFEWYQRSPRSHGGRNPVASEVDGVAHSNFTASNQMSSGVPEFNSAPIANGHGDQVSAAFHSNPMSVANGSSNYEPAFGPSTNRGR